MATEADRQFARTSGQFWLWAGVLVGPAAWMIQFQANYLLVFVACSTGALILLHLTSLAALVVTAAAAFISWRNWQRAGREWSSEGEGVVPRSRFMAVLGLFVSVLFFIVIVGQALPGFFLGPCEK